MLPSTPSPTATTCSDSQSLFLQHELSYASNNVQLPSPSPSISLPFTSAPSQYYSSPQCLPPMPAIHLPSSLPQHCGSDMGMGGYNDFGWSQSNFAPQYATTV